jgi:hypothetical protein
MNVDFAAICALNPTFIAETDPCPLLGERPTAGFLGSDLPPVDRPGAQHVGAELAAEDVLGGA